MWTLIDEKLYHFIFLVTRKTKNIVEQNTNFVDNWF